MIGGRDAITLKYRIRSNGKDLRDLKRDRAMTRKALGILAVRSPNAYASALAALQEDTRSFWLECLEEPPRDSLSYKPRLRHWRPGFAGIGLNGTRGRFRNLSIVAQLR